MEVAAPILKNTALHDSISQALELTGKLMKLTARTGDQWRAMQIAIDIATLSDNAFGWDSLEAAAAYKEVLTHSSISFFNREFA